MYLFPDFLLLCVVDAVDGVIAALCGGCWGFVWRMCLTGVLGCVCFDGGFGFLTGFSFATLLRFGRFIIVL